MNLGISTACFYPLETEKAFEAVCKGGVSHTEIFFNAACELESDFVELLCKIRDEYGITVTSVHPTMSLAESFMFFSDYQRRYEQGMEQYKRYAQIAARLGARYIIMHGGKPNKVLDDLGYCERFYNIARAVKENGAELLQENVVNHRAGSIEFLKLMADNLGDEVGFCLDVKQSVRGGYSPFDALRAVHKNIKHLHISDHIAGHDCLLPKNGSFDFAAFFAEAKSLGYSGAALIEVYKDAYADYGEIFNSLRLLQTDLKNPCNI